MKIFRIYIVTVIVCLCITSVISAFFIADETAKKVTLGEEYAVLVLNSTDEKYNPDSFNPLPLLEKLKEGAEKAASIAPPPVGNIYWFLVNSKNAMN